jgi:hypothetical protein
MSRPSVTAALAVVLLVACDSGLSPGEPSVESEAIGYQPAAAAVPNPSFQPFAFPIDNCLETVDVAGTFHEVTHFFLGPGGKEHFRFHINAKGTGVGRLTGTRYQWNDRLFDITNVAPSETVSFTLNDYTRMIGQGSAVNLRLAAQIKVTINARGVVTVDRFRVRAICG